MTQGLTLTERSEGKGEAKGIHKSCKLFRKPKVVLNSDEHRLLSLDSANAPSERKIERDMCRKAFGRAEEGLSQERSKEYRLKDAGTGATVRSILTVAALNHHDLYDTID